MPFSSETRISLTQALFTFRSVLVARSTPCWMASSKLLLDVALNSVTLATDMALSPFRMVVIDDPDVPHSKSTDPGLPAKANKFLRVLPRPDHLPAHDNSASGSSSTSGETSQYDLKGLPLVRAERFHALGEGIALRLLVYLEIEPLPILDGEVDLLPGHAPAAEHGPAG